MSNTFKFFCRYGSNWSQILWSIILKKIRESSFLGMLFRKKIPLQVIYFVRSTIFWVTVFICSIIEVEERLLLFLYIYLAFLLCSILLTQWRNISLFHNTFVFTIQKRSQFENVLPPSPLFVTTLLNVYV